MTNSQSQAVQELFGNDEISRLYKFQHKTENHRILPSFSLRNNWQNQQVIQNSKPCGH